MYAYSALSLIVFLVMGVIAFFYAIDRFARVALRSEVLRPVPLHLGPGEEVVARHVRRQ